MSDVILICGMICSGKSHYARKLAKERNAVILSCDEISADIFHHAEGERFDDIAADIKRYLHKIAARIAGTGGNVILDWGFWTRAERREVSEYYAACGITCEWHYIDIPEPEWRCNIGLRNKAVAAGETSDFFVDDGLMAKLLSLFETPKHEEMDHWLKFKRE